MMEINEQLDHDILIYFPNKRFKLKNLVINSNSLFLYYSSLDLQQFSKINVILKNIKTREEYQCNFKVTNEYIKIDLDTLTDYFTDYEATIFIALQKDKTIYYIPVVAPFEISATKNETYSNNNYQWFIRTSPNGELRLSSYKLITA